MPILGLNLFISGANALASDLVIGPPPPMSFAFYLRALVNEACKQDYSVKGVALGLRSFNLDRGRAGKPVPFRTATDSFVRRTSNDMLKITCYDELRCDLHVSLVVDLDCPELEVPSVVKALRDELVFSPCCGGIVEQTSNVTDLGKDWLTFLRGSSVLVDRSESLRNLSKTIGKSEFEVLLDLASRKMQAALSAEYAEQLDALGYVVPVPVGYRLLTEQSSERRGRRCDLPHAFAETVTGLGEYVSAWRINQNQAGHILWKPKSNSQLIYFMES